MKVLLVNPFFPTSRTPVKERWSSYFPFGIGYIASYLLKKGVQVEILDVLGKCLTIENVKEELAKSKADIVGITAMSSQYLYVKGLSKYVKETLNIPIILGGALATHSYKTVMENTDVDICVIGEGEFATHEIIENLNDLTGIKGIAYKNANNIELNDPRPPCRDRDIMPFPAYDLFDMDQYTKISLYSEAKTVKKYAGLKCAYLISGTGCPFKCNFCSKNLSVGYRSVDNIIEEIKYLMKNYNVRGFHFGDELLIVNRKRIIEFAKKVKPLNVFWAGQARVDTVDYELLNIMKESGCIAIGYGIETGSQRLLDAMNKGVKLNQIEDAINWTRDLGIEMKIQLMIGYIGEDQSTLKDTVDFFKKILHPGRRFNIFTPLPGSKIYNDCISNDVIKDEETYLSKLSLGKYGFVFNKPLINLSKFSDEELIEKKDCAEREMKENYKKHLLTHPKLLFHYLINNLLTYTWKLLKKFSRYSKISYYKEKLNRKKLDMSSEQTVALQYFLWSE